MELKAATVGKKEKEAREKGERAYFVRLRFLSLCPESYLPIEEEAKMKVIAAYLLAVLGGNAHPSADNLKKILGSVGAEADDTMIKLLLSQVQGKDLTELIAAGREKLASVPAGGTAVAPVAVAAPAGGAGAAEAAPAAEEPKKAEVEEEDEEDYVLNLFD
ncbi:hypothetical protein Drorol1_Dr00026300 [Drosera rotundifolia]